MTNQRSPRFISLLTANDPTEVRRGQLMSKAFWLASEPSPSPRLAQVIDLRPLSSIHQSQR
jgi:hypothetical protein